MDLTQLEKRFGISIISIIISIIKILSMIISHGSMAGRYRRMRGTVSATHSILDTKLPCHLTVAKKQYVAIRWKAS